MLIGHVPRYHQIDAHEPQLLSRLERQPDNPGIAARCKDLGEQVLLEPNPSAWRFVADKEMPFLPVAQQLRLLIRLSLLRRNPGAAGKAAKGSKITEASRPHRKGSPARSTRIRSPYP